MKLVDLRFVPCEVRPEKVFHFLDEWRLVEKLRFCITIAIKLSALGVHVVNGWARAYP